MKHSSRPVPRHLSGQAVSLSVLRGGIQDKPVSQNNSVRRMTMRKFFLLIAMLVLVAVAITGAAAAPKILIYARGADSDRKSVV